MKITINGRILTERAELLGEQEKRYFEVIAKSAVYLIVGGIYIICYFIFDVTDTLLPFNFGSDRIVDTFKIFP